MSTAPVRGLGARKVFAAGAVVSAAVGVAVGVAPLAPESAAAAPAGPERVDHVVVVGVPGLRWEHVDDERMPAVARLADEGSIGTLSARSAPSTTCPAEGWLTLGAGTYAASSDPDSNGGCANRPVEAVHTQGEGGGVLPTFDRIKRLNDTLRFGAEPGRLGDGVDCAAAIGPGAAMAAADPNGRVAWYAPELPTDPGPLLTRCPLTVVSAPSVDSGRDLSAADATVSAVAGAMPERSLLVVAGISESADTGSATGPSLHAVVVHGDGVQRGWLRSPSTRRVPYVQLVDLAPTVLESLGETVPDAMAGRPVYTGEKGRPRALDQATETLADDDARAVAARRAVPWFWAGVGVLSLLIYAFAVLALRRGRDPPAVRRALLGLAAVPVATFAAGLVPWWRAPEPAQVPVLFALVVAMAGALAAVALAGPWRRQPAGPVTVVAGAGVLVVGLDVLTGGNLQIDTMIGYSPLVAGRFYGLGNIAFAVFGACGILLAAGLAEAGRSRYLPDAPRRGALTALAIVLAVAGVVVALDGAPAWGADFGGVLTLVPTFVVLALLAVHARITVVRLALAGVAGAALVFTLGLFDWLGPPEDRSHFGRFVGSIVDGTAWHTIERKIEVNLDLLLAGPHSVAAALLVLGTVVLVLRPPARLKRAYDQDPALRPALVGVVMLGLVGAATNDSGIAVPLLAGVVVLPIAVLACLRTDGRTDSDDTDDTPTTGAVAEPEPAPRVLP